MAKRRFLSKLTQPQRECYLKARAKGKSTTASREELYGRFPEAHEVNLRKFYEYERSETGKEDLKELSRIGAKGWRILSKILIAQDFVDLFHLTVKNNPEDTLRLKHLGAEARLALDAIRDEDLPFRTDSALQSAAGDILAAAAKLKSTVAKVNEEGSLAEALGDLKLDPN